MAVIVGASTSIPLRRRNRNALAAGIWLVFLAYAVMSLQSSHLPPWRIALGWMGLAIFALFYLALFWWHVDGLELWYTKHQVRASAIVGQIMLVVLCALLALVRPKVAASVLAYPIAFAVFQMPEIALEITLAIEVVGMAVLVWTTPDLMPWAICSAISVAVVTVVGVLERAACRGQLARQAEQDVLARLEERQRVASDVHDLLGQTLTVMAMKAQLVERLIGTDPDAARAQAVELHGLSRHALAQVRELVSGMARMEVDAQLAAARTALEAAGVECVVSDSRTHGGHEEDSAFDTVRGWVLREAVTNVVRHAQSHTCLIEVGDEILAISDDGRGRSNAPEGNGLTGMRRRVEAAGGELWIGPGERDHGTRIIVTG